MVATTAALALLVPATAACLALLVPTLAGFLPRRARPQSAPTHTFVVLVPAHDEEATLPATLRSLAGLDYPRERVRVCVVADNCTDNTAGVARLGGVTCVVRRDLVNRGKGYAVAFGLTRVLRDAPDVVLVLDADCELNPEALRELDAVFTTGAEVAQCAVRSRNADDGPAGFVAAVGATVDERVAMGLDRLGFTVPLRGTGMAIRRDVLEAIPWTAFGAVEDAEYAGKLRAAGVRVRHCAGAVVLCEAPANLADLCRQRRRWRATGVLVSKPLGLGLIATATTTGLAAGFGWWPAALVVLTGAIYLRAVFAVGASWRRLALMLRSPGVVVRLAWVSLVGVVRGKPLTWDRTPRPTETERRVA